jgi:serine/threonine protein kinase
MSKPPRKTDPSDRLNPQTSLGDRSGGAMATSDDQHEPPDFTTPDEIVALGIDAEATFRRVCLGLGIAAASELEIGRFRVRSKLGEGGMGVVYLAYDPKLEREVAIKLVNTRPFVNADKLRKRLLREAQMLAKLAHANVVSIFEVGEHAGEVFLAMEYVDGQSLREWQEAPNRSTDELLRLYVEAGRGLAAAHKQGIVHRDFKPDNVFVDAEGRARVGDFGLAHVLDDDVASEAEPGVGSSSARVTQTGELLGTLGYMAPEQLCGGKVDPRTDQYAFCVSLWEAVTGSRPYDQATRDELLAAMRGTPPRGGERLPNWLRRALEAGLAPAAEGRHRGMLELVAVLERGLARPERWRLGGAFGLAGLVLVSGLTALWMSGDEPGPQCQSQEISMIVDKLATVEDGEEWSAYLERLEPHEQRALVRSIRRQTRRAFDACLREDLAHAQAIDRWASRIVAVGARAPSLSDHELSKITAELDRELLDDRPRRALSPAAHEVMKILSALYDESRLDEVIARSTAELENVKLEVDRAELLLHRGRARYLTGDHDLAIEDLQAAIVLADGDKYDDARARAYLLIAKIAAIRLERYDLVRTYLAYADGVFRRLQEPAASTWRLEHLQISATVDVEERAFDEAAVKQRFVVLGHALAGDRFGLATALTNLGFIEEFRADSEAAERWYRAALAVDPEDVEPGVNLARLLVNRGEDEPLSAEIEEEARSLLDRVLASEHRDLHGLARVVLLQRALQTHDLQEIARRRDQLVVALDNDESVTPSHRRQAWMFLAIAYAALGDIGPAYQKVFAQLPAEDVLVLAEVELSGAAQALSVEPEVARSLAERALARLESAPDTEMRRELLSNGAALVAGLEP